MSRNVHLRFAGIPKFSSFLDYLDQAPGMSIGLHRYLAAEDKKGIRYCLVEEGGWLLPTLGTDGKPDEARIKTLEKVLAPPFSQAVPANP